MTANPLPKGFIDHRGVYVIKGKRAHQDLLRPEEVREWKAMLEEELKTADKFDRKIIQKELTKLTKTEG